MPENTEIKEYLTYEFLKSGFFSCCFTDINTELIRRLDSAGVNSCILKKTEFENRLIAVAGFALPAAEKMPDMGSYGAIAPFASCNFYREAAERCRIIREKTCRHLAINEKTIRIFCNSELPEKLFGSLSGLGQTGKNSLLINETAGSRFIIAGLVIPGFSTDESVAREPPGTVCGSCSLCVRACPTKALRGDGSVDRELCIQALSSRLEILSPEIMNKFENRIYGCQDCQSGCPLNKNKIHGEYIDRGFLGQFYPLDKLLKAGLSAINLRDFFMGTVLSAAWMDQKAFIRNAIIAAANNNSTELTELIKQYRRSENPVLSYTAEWALEKLGKSCP